MEKFKPVNSDQLSLLPPGVEDFVPADHLAELIKEVVWQQKLLKLLTSLCRQLF